MQKNNGGFSILIGMGLMVLITLSAYVILSFIMPFMKNTKGIENTSNSYYQAYKGIEQSLYHTKQRLVTTGQSLTTETGATIGGSVRYIFKTYSSGSTIPIAGYGNSEYNSGYNLISMQNPIQLEIGEKSHKIHNLLSGLSDISIVLKVPDFKGGGTPLSLSGTNIVNWLLSSDNNTLMASGSIIKSIDVNNSVCSTAINMKSNPGVDLFGNGTNFQSFYNTNCNSTSSGCILKMSIIDNLVLTDNTPIPYLEYKLTFPESVADRYTRIESTGESYGFQKKLDVRVPQQTAEQSFDFTVF